MISDSTLSRFVDPKFRDVAVPILTWEAGVYDDLKMTGPTEADYGISVNQTQLTIATPGHALAAGLNGLVTTHKRSTAFLGCTRVWRAKIATTRQQPDRHFCL